VPAVGTGGGEGAAQPGIEKRLGERAPSQQAQHAASHQPGEPAREGEAQDLPAPHPRAPPSLEEVDPEAAAVLVELAPELRHRAAVLVPDQRLRGVAEGVPGREQPVEEVEIPSPLGGGPHVERGVEPSQRFEHLTAEGHVGPHSGVMGGQERLGRQVAGDEGLRHESLPHAAVAQLEPVLRLRLQLQRRHESGHARHAGIGEGAAERAQPAGIHHRVVVGVGHDGPAGFLQSPVTRPVEPGAVLAHVVHGEGGAQAGRGVRGGRVVHHQDLVTVLVEILHGQQRVQAAPQEDGAIPGADHDRDGRRRRRFRRRQPTSQDGGHQVPAQVLADALPQLEGGEDGGPPCGEGEPPHGPALEADEEPGGRVPLAPGHRMDALRQLDLPTRVRRRMSRRRTLAGMLHLPEHGAGERPP
jgi:hypothetical protein